MTTTARNNDTDGGDAGTHDVADITWGSGDDDDGGRSWFGDRGLEDHCLGDNETTEQCR